MLAGHITGRPQTIVMLQVAAKEHGDSWRSQIPVLVAFAGFGFGFGEKRTHSRTRIDHVIDPICNEHQLIWFAMNSELCLSHQWQTHQKKTTKKGFQEKKTHPISLMSSIVILHPRPIQAWQQLQLRCLASWRCPEFWWDEPWVGLMGEGRNLDGWWVGLMGEGRNLDGWWVGLMGEGRNLDGWWVGLMGEGRNLDGWWVGLMGEGRNLDGWWVGLMGEGRNLDGWSVGLMGEGRNLDGWWVGLMGEGRNLDGWWVGLMGEGRNLPNFDLRFLMFCWISWKIILASFFLERASLRKFGFFGAWDDWENIWPVEGGHLVDSIPAIKGPRATAKMKRVRRDMAPFPATMLMPETKTLANLDGWTEVMQQIVHSHNSYIHTVDGRNPAPPGM